MVVPGLEEDHAWLLYRAKRADGAWAVTARVTPLEPIRSKQGVLRIATKLGGQMLDVRGVDR